MTRGYFIGLVIGGIFIQAIFLIFITQFGMEHLHSSGLAIQGVLMWYISYKSRMQMKSKKDFDERAQYLAYKTLSISSFVFICALMILADLRYEKIFGNEIRDVFGYILLPLFLVIWGTVGLIILAKES